MQGYQVRANRSRILWSDGLFRSNDPETAGLTRLPGYERPNLQIAFRSLRIRMDSGTADILSVAVGAAEVTGEKVAFEGYQRRQDESQFGWDLDS